MVVEGHGWRYSSYIAVLVSILLAHRSNYPPLLTPHNWHPVLSVQLTFQHWCLSGHDPYWSSVQRLAFCPGVPYIDATVRRGSHKLVVHNDSIGDPITVACKCGLPLPGIRAATCPAAHCSIPWCCEDQTCIRGQEYGLQSRTVLHISPCGQHAGFLQTRLPLFCRIGVHRRIIQKVRRRRLTACRLSIPCRIFALNVLPQACPYWMFTQIVAMRGTWVCITKTLAW